MDTQDVAKEPVVRINSGNTSNVNLLKPLIAPFVNLNGTTKAMLLSQQMNVVDRLDEAIQALFIAMPHGRDYQTCGDTISQRTINQNARDAFGERIKLLRDMRSDFWALLEATNNQG